MGARASEMRSPSATKHVSPMRRPLASPGGHAARRAAKLASEKMHVLGHQVLGDGAGIGEAHRCRRGGGSERLCSGNICHGKKFSRGHVARHPVRGGVTRVALRWSFSSLLTYDGAGAKGGRHENDTTW